MREILFKAKRKDWKELPKEQWWVEGYYVYCRKRHYILPVLNKAIGFDEREDEWIEIDPDTLCQYTGLTDKNGKKIWENDIVTITLECDDYLIPSETGIVEYGYGHYELKVKASDGQESYSNLINKLSEAPFEIEKLGNIFDNANLLEVK